LIVFLLSELLLRVFTNPTDAMLAMAPGIAGIYSISLLFLPLNIFGTYCFQAVMRQRMALIVSVTRGFALSGTLVLLPALFGPDCLFRAIPLTELAVAGFQLSAIRGSCF
jgi:Na+-driven multidrug efflux pump